MGIDALRVDNVVKGEELLCNSVNYKMVQAGIVPVWSDSIFLYICSTLYVTCCWWFAECQPKFNLLVVVEPSDSTLLKTTNV